MFSVMESSSGRVNSFKTSDYETPRSSCKVGQLVNGRKQPKESLDLLLTITREAAVLVALFQAVKRPVLRSRLTVNLLLERLYKKLAP